MKPTVKVFDKKNPCTKADIWACFRVAAGFRLVPVVEAHSYIGLNVPRIMERNGRIVLVAKQGIEYYRLTPEGQEWLLNGFRAYLKNHPSYAPNASHLPADWGYSQRHVRLRRTR